MTTIVWARGIGIAADRMQSYGDTVFRCGSKLAVAGASVFSGTGAATKVREFSSRMTTGAPLTEMQFDGFAGIEATVDSLRMYECPYPSFVEQDFMAFGVGREVALGYLSGVLSVRELALEDLVGAIGAAIRHTNGSGLGVDVVGFHGATSWQLCSYGMDAACGRAVFVEGAT